MLGMHDGSKEILKFLAIPEHQDQPVSHMELLLNTENRQDRSPPFEGDECHIYELRGR